MGRGNTEYHLRRSLLVYLIALISGYVSILLQIALMRLLALSAGSSEYTFCIVVSAFILALAWGAARPASFTKTTTLLITGFVLFYLSIPYWPYACHVLRSFFPSTLTAFYLYHAALFGVFFAAIFLPVSSLGRVLPSLFLSVRKNAGLIYAVNSIGCVLGALTGGYSNTFWNHFPVWPAQNFSLGTFRERQANKYTYQGPEAFYGYINRGMSLLYRKDGPNGSVGVVEGISAGSVGRSIVVNGKSDSNTVFDRETTTLSGLIPCQLSHPKTAAVIGYGTGITAGVIADYPGVKQLDVYEISDEVKEAAPFFDCANNEASHKVNWIMGDAFSNLSGKYDMITAEPSNPWVAGVDRLYSIEFLNLAMDHLNENGVYAEWFHTYDASIEMVGTIVRTFSEVFPFVRLFHLADHTDYMLVGSMHPVETLKDREIKTPSDLSRFTIQTLDNPTLSYTAGKEFFMESSIELIPLHK